MLPDDSGDRFLRIIRKFESPAKRNCLFSATVVMPVETNVSIDVAERFGFRVVVDQTGKSERRLARDEMLKTFLKMCAYRFIVIRRYPRQIVKYVVYISGCLDRMGQDIVDVIPARRKRAERFKLGKQRR